MTQQARQTLSALALDPKEIETLWRRGKQSDAVRKVADASRMSESGARKVLRQAFEE